MPMSMNISLLLGSRYSLLSMRAMAFLAPSFLASIAATTLSFSTWFTAMNRSHLRTCALRSTAKVVESPSTEITSARLPTSESSFWSASMMVMSWPLPLSIFARWLPISPAPAITIFIVLRLLSFRFCAARRQDKAAFLQFILQMYTFVTESQNFST